MSRVYVIYTGGTIGMRPTQYGLVPATRAQLLQYLDGYGSEEGIEWELEGLTDEHGQEVAPLDSAGVTPTHWLTIARAIERRYQEFDGFVVLHGTDTMAYTASALSFLLVNLGKPVVVTGAQMPIFAKRSDARQNLINALYVAGWKAVGLPLVPEVTICFGDVLLRGNRTRKVSTTAWQGFASPNYPKLGSIGASIHILPELVRRAPEPEAAFYVERRLVDDVLDITLFPGLKASQLAALVDRPELRGLLLRAYGSGNTPDDQGLLEVIGRAARAGKTVLVVTQCTEGRVDLGRYQAGWGLLEHGVSGAFDMTPEAALTKLMWLLSRENPGEIRAQLQLNQRGEQSVNLRQLRFGPGGPGRLVEAGAQLPASPGRQRLERATLRLKGIELTPAEPVEVRFFLNAPGMSRDTPPSDVRCLGSLQVRPGHSQAGLDVTEGVRRLMSEDRPLHLSVLVDGDGQLEYRELQLDLLTGV